MIVDIADWIRGQIILHIDDRTLFDKFSNDSMALQVCPYYRGKQFVGGDIWFKKKYKDTLIRRLEKLGIELKK